MYINIYIHKTCNQTNIIIHINSLEKFWWKNMLRAAQQEVHTHTHSANRFVV